MYKTGNPTRQLLQQLVSKLSLEQVHEEQSLETPEMAKKLYSRPGPSAKQRSASPKFVKKNKSLTVERGRNDYLFLDQCPKYIVSAALSKKLYCLGVEVTPAYQVIKKLKMNHLGLYMLHGLSHLMPKRLQGVIKNKGGMPVTELLNTSTRQSKKHILEISCKIQF